jgi:hypothetical protein
LGGGGLYHQGQYIPLLFKEGLGGKGLESYTPVQSTLLVVDYRYYISRSGYYL